MQLAHDKIIAGAATSDERVIMKRRAREAAEQAYERDIANRVKVCYPSFPELSTAFITRDCLSCPVLPAGYGDPGEAAGLGRERRDAGRGTGAEEARKASRGAHDREGAYVLLYIP